MVRTQIQLTEKQSKALKRLSVKKQMSIAELIRQGVNILLRSAEVVSPEEKQKRAISVAGRFHSGLSDLSSRHDEHFSEAYSKR